MKTRIALWKNTSKNGTLYFTGETDDKKKIIMFKNEKRSENEPDYRLYYQTDAKENNGLVSISGLWYRKSKSGIKYLNGFDKNKGFSVNIFANTDATGKKPVMSGSIETIEKQTVATEPVAVPFEI